MLSARCNIRSFFRSFYDSFQNAFVLGCAVCYTDRRSNNREHCTCLDVGALDAGLCRFSLRSIWLCWLTMVNATGLIVRAVLPCHPLQCLAKKKCQLRNRCVVDPRLRSARGDCDFIVILRCLACIEGAEQAEEEEGGQERRCKG